MNSYSIIALFLHIVGALGFFLALGLEWTGLWQIRSAMTLEQVRVWMGIFRSVRKVGFISMMTIVITGIYMIVTYWGGQPWIIVMVGSLVLVILLAQVLTAPRMAAIGQALVTEKRPLSQNFHNLANQPVLWISIQTRVAIALGIVFLKISKSDLGEALLTIAVAIVLGFVSALPMLRPVRVHEASTD
jgi:hypothetical protein